MPTRPGVIQEPRTKDRTQHGDVGARLEVERTIRQIFLQDRARGIIAHAIRKGWVTPKPGSPQWLEIINQGLESGLLCKPKNNGRRLT